MNEFEDNTEIPKEIEDHFREEFKKQSDEEAKDKIQLPPYPECLFELTDEQQAYYRYGGDETDLTGRMRHKLWLSWQLWARFRNDPRIIEIVSKMKEEERGSDVFYICNSVINMIDVFGRVLGQTNITEELFGGDEKEKDATP